MPFDDQKFLDLQGVLRKKFSDLNSHRESKSFEGKSLGGKVLVKITMSNFVEYKVEEVKIDPTVLNEKPGMVEDLIKAAFDDAFRKSDEHNKDFFSSMMSVRI